MSNEPKVEVLDPGDRIAELEQDIERLRVEVEAYRTGGKAAVGVATLLIAGPSLVKALWNWIQLLLEEGKLPPKETADLCAAVIRRFIRVALVSTAIALIPLLLLAWQNRLMNIQNSVIQETSTRVWRAQLVATVYDERCDPEPGRNERDEEWERCTPKAHLFSRVEAASALVDLDRTCGRVPTLRNADLRGAALWQADLDGVILDHSRLDEADLVRASLVKASLGKADLIASHLTGAVLDGALLNNANLQRADLMTASMRGAVLTGATLDGANLSGADLSDAELSFASLRGAKLYKVENLTKDQLATAIIDANTRLPDHLAVYMDELLAASKENQKMRETIYDDGTDEAYWLMPENESPDPPGPKPQPPNDP